VQSLNEVPAERGLCYFFFGSAFPTVFSQLYLWLLVFAFHAAGIVRRRVAFACFVCAIWCRSSRSSKMLWPKMAEAKKPSKSLYVNQKRHQHRANQPSWPSWPRLTWVAYNELGQLHKARVQTRFGVGATFSSHQPAKIFFICSKPTQMQPVYAWQKSWTLRIMSYLSDRLSWLKIN